MERIGRGYADLMVSVMGNHTLVATTYWVFLKRVRTGLGEEHI